MTNNNNNKNNQPSLHESKSTQQLNSLLVEEAEEETQQALPLPPQQETRPTVKKPKVVKVEIWLVRHGETDYNAEGRVQGQLDIELNELGVEQAHLVAHSISNHYISHHGAVDRFYSHIFSSDLKRASKTGQVICEALNKKTSNKKNSGDGQCAEEQEEASHFQMQLDPRLREINFGDHLAGKHWKDIRSEPLDTPYVKIGGVNNPNAESHAELQQRFNEGVEALCMHYIKHEKNTEKPKGIIVACHGGGIRTQTCKFLQVPLTSMRIFQVHNTSVHRFGLYVDREASLESGQLQILKREVIELNNTSHLRVVRDTLQE